MTDTAFSSRRVHRVFITKYDRRVFDARSIDVLRRIFTNVSSNAHATLVETDGEDDHMHLLMENPCESRGLLARE